MHGSEGCFHVGRSILLNVRNNGVPDRDMGAECPFIYELWISILLFIHLYKHILNRCFSEVFQVASNENWYFFQHNPFFFTSSYSKTGVKRW